MREEHLLNLVGALDVPDEGTITVGGADLGHLDDLAQYRASTVGFVFQFHHFIPTLAARENVEMPMMGGSPTRRARMARAQPRGVCH